MVSLGELVQAIAEASDEDVWFLHTETGILHSTSRNALNLALGGRLSEGDLGTAPPAVRAAWIIIGDSSGSYLQLPGGLDVVELSIMRKFASAVSDQKLAQRILGSLNDFNAFRTFPILIRRANLQTDWEKFRLVELEAVAIEWCRAHGIAVH